MYSIPYVPSNAGFFIWADLSSYASQEQGNTHLERERALNNRLLDGGVHLATSEAFSGEHCSWFRICFALDRKILELGLARYSPRTSSLIGYSMILILGAKPLMKPMKST